MKKEAKAEIVKDLKEKFGRSNIVILFDYKGMTVEQINSLRRSIEKAGDNDFQVVKNTLARRALADTPIESFGQRFVGPNAALFVYGDPVVPAKILVENAEKVNLLQIKFALLQKRELSPDQIIALSRLPSKELLLGKLLGTFQAPISGFVSVLAQVPRGLLNALTAIKQKKEAA